MKQRDVLTKNNDFLNVMFRGTPCMSGSRLHEIYIIVTFKRFSQIFDHIENLKVTCYYGCPFKTISKEERLFMLKKRFFKDTWMMVSDILRTYSNEFNYKIM